MVEELPCRDRVQPSKRSCEMDVDCASITVRYAVPGLYGKSKDLEGFVMAYRNEHSLRQIMAAFCIVETDSNPGGKAPESSEIVPA
jgi:hypothetical protein